MSMMVTGCNLGVGRQVPKLTLGINPYTHEVTLSNPKDTIITKFQATINTNGSSVVSFDSLSTVMNPSNIVNTGNAEASIITATGQVIQNAVSAAGTATGSAIGAAAKTP
jgi:hypothetical protein